jgi:hypothetical protein
MQPIRSSVSITLAAMKEPFPTSVPRQSSSTRTRLLSVASAKMVLSSAISCQQSSLACQISWMHTLLALKVIQQSDTEKGSHREIYFGNSPDQTQKKY